MNRTRRFLGLSIAILTLLGLCATPRAEAAGKKYGLFIGIDRYADGPLRGAVNDAREWRKGMIEMFGFAAIDTRLLVDGAATRKGIMDAIASYKTRVGPGDIFVVTYSGHGSLFPDLQSEDIDETRQTFVDMWFGDDHYVVPRGYYDSTICPIDSSLTSSGKPWQNQILDDELFAMFAPFVANGAKVVFISDSCHSGTISKGEKKEGIDARPRFLSPNALFGGKKYEDIKFKSPGMQRKVESLKMNGSYLALSGSKDNEVSWDARINGVFNGMFTSHTMRILRERGVGAKAMTYTGLMNTVSGSVVNATRTGGFPTIQTPQMTLVFGNPSDKIFQP